MIMRSCSPKSPACKQEIRLQSASPLNHEGLSQNREPLRDSWDSAGKGDTLGDFFAGIIVPLK